MEVQGRCARQEGGLRHAEMDNPEAAFHEGIQSEKGRRQVASGKRPPHVGQHLLPVLGGWHRAPVIDELGNDQGPCYSDGGEEGEVPQAGQILLVAPGEHTFSLDVLKDVVEQPIRRWPIRPPMRRWISPKGRESKTATRTWCRTSQDRRRLRGRRQGRLQSREERGLRRWIRPASRSVRWHHRHPDGRHHAPTIGGTYQRWTGNGYQQRDISGLEWGMGINWQGVSVTIHDNGYTGD